MFNVAAIILPFRVFVAQLARPTSSQVEWYVPAWRRGPSHCVGPAILWSAVRAKGTQGACVS